MISAIIANTETYEAEKQTQIEDAEERQIPLNEHIEQNKNTGKVFQCNFKMYNKNYPNGNGTKLNSGSLVADAMVIQETNSDRKKLRNGKYINVKVMTDLNKVGEDNAKNPSVKQKTQLKKPTKRKSNGVEELDTKAPMLAQNENDVMHANSESELSKEQDSNEESENMLKKTKMESYNGTEEEELKIVHQKPASVQQKCEYCCQKLTSDNIKIYPGHPNGAVEEFIALTDPKLSLFTGEEANVHEGDERPQNKITDFWYV